MFIKETFLLQRGLGLESLINIYLIVNSLVGKVAMVGMRSSVIVRVHVRARQWLSAPDIIIRNLLFVRKNGRFSTTLEFCPISFITGPSRPAIDANKLRWGKSIYHTFFRVSTRRWRAKFTNVRKLSCRSDAASHVALFKPSATRSGVQCAVC